jgi:deazaflavin-dependent oxidoreductase (nitroreductase family)
MSREKRPTKWVWRAMRRMSGRVAGLVRAGRGPAGVVLVLTTTGRKSGLRRETPLQYEQVGEDYYIASARGPRADWFRNLQANPRVEVEVQGKRFAALAEPVTDPLRIADFLALRLERHPRMVGLIMRLEGFPLRYTRADLEKFAAGKALAVLRPVAQGE